MAVANGNYTGFADQPTTTVSNGGTSAPAQGTSEQWTVASSATFPPASIGVYPNASQMFHVADTAATSEIIAVTAVTGTVWGVTRGVENTTPVTHSGGFTVQQVVSAEDLGSMIQLQQNGATVSTVNSGANALGTMATYTPMPRDIPAPGVVYDFHAYGLLQTTTATSLLTLSTTWNGTTIASMVSNTGHAGGGGTLGTAQVNGPFWIEGRVDCWGATTMVCGMNFQSVNTVATHTISTMVACSTAGVTISGTAGPLSLVVQSTTGMTVTTMGGSFFRIS